MPLSDKQRERYARHLALPEIGEKGQEKQAGKGHKAENDDRNVIEKGARVPLKGGVEP